MSKPLRSARLTSSAGTARTRAALAAIASDRAVEIYMAVQIDADMEVVAEI